MLTPLLPIAAYRAVLDAYVRNAVALGYSRVEALDLFARDMPAAAAVIAACQE